MSKSKIHYNNSLQDAIYIIYVDLIGLWAHMIHQMYNKCNLSWIPCNKSADAI